MSAEIQQEQVDQSPTAITEVNTAVAEFDRVAAGIGQLKQQYAGVVFDVATTAGMKAACDARSAIRAPRYEVEKVRKAVKAPILALGRDIDARAAKITAELLAIEEPIDTHIKAEESRKEAERKAKIEAERARVAAIQGDIENDLRGVPAAMVGRCAADLEVTIRDVVAIEITVERFGEFVPVATAVKESTLAKLRDMQARQLAHEGEQERVRLEREQLEQQRLAQEEANRKERERIAAEEAEAKRLREQREAETLAAIKAHEAAAAADRKRQLDEQMEKLRAERAENERVAKQQREQREREEADRRERQRIEDAQRQAERAESERLAELGQARMDEIMAMGHQVMIASVGRAGVRRGGTRECIVETLAETEAWPVTEDNFGPLLAMATSARQRACDQIRAALAAFDQAEELQRQQAELDRQRQEQEATARAEQQRLEAQRAELERQQQLAATASVTISTPIDVPKQVEPGVIELAPHPDATIEDVAFQPTADDLIGLVAAEYGVSLDLAAKWLRDAFAPVGEA